jgi:hypothetical protein
VEAHVRAEETFKLLQVARAQWTQCMRPAAHRSPSPDAPRETATSSSPFKYTEALRRARLYAQRSSKSTDDLRGVEAAAWLHAGALGSSFSKVSHSPPQHTDRISRHALKGYRPSSEDTG